MAMTATVIFLIAFDREGGILQSGDSESHTTGSSVLREICRSPGRRIPPLVFSVWPNDLGYHRDGERALALPAIALKGRVGRGDEILIY